MNFSDSSATASLRLVLRRSFSVNNVCGLYDAASESPWCAPSCFPFCVRCVSMRMTTDFLMSAVICCCTILPSFPDSSAFSVISAELAELCEIKPGMHASKLFHWRSNADYNGRVACTAMVLFLGCSHRYVCGKEIIEMMKDLREKADNL